MPFKSDKRAKKITVNLNTKECEMWSSKDGLINLNIKLEGYKEQLSQEIPYEQANKDELADAITAGYITADGFDHIEYIKKRLSGEIKEGPEEVIVTLAKGRNFWKSPSTGEEISVFTTKKTIKAKKGTKLYEELSKGLRLGIFVVVEQEIEIESDIIMNQRMAKMPDGVIVEARNLLDDDATGKIIERIEKSSKPDIPFLTALYGLEMSEKKPRKEIIKMLEAKLASYGEIIDDEIDKYLNHSVGQVAS